VTWHTVTVAEDDLDQLFRTIRRTGGAITHSFPCPDGYTVIYTTVED
jgi:hypothetical protein